MSTDTVPQTIAGTLRAIADQIESDDIGDIRLSINIQVTSSGDATQVQRAAAIEAIAGLFDGRLQYSGGIGHYSGSNAQFNVYGRMQPPPAMFAAMWDEAHAEQTARRAQRLINARAAADRLQEWFNSHDECCGSGYRQSLDHELELAQASLVGAVVQLDPDAVEVTCGRCAIATGAHTFGRGCAARLESVFVQPDPEPRLCHCDADIVMPHAMHKPFAAAVRGERPELLHVVGPEDVAPGEPDDRGWDTAITVTYVDELGASA